LLLSGHSLGGALSVVAAAFFGQALGLSARPSASSHAGAGAFFGQALGLSARLSAPSHVGAGAGACSNVAVANVAVATFGCPRTGTVAFKELFDASTSNCWRVVRKGDPITKTPFRNPASRSAAYEHVGIELLVDANGDMVLEPTLVEHVLLHRCVHGSPRDHRTLAYLSSLLIFSLGLYGKHVLSSGKAVMSGGATSDATGDATSDAAALADAAGARCADEGAFYPRLWGNVAHSLSKVFAGLLGDADAGAHAQSTAMCIVQDFLRSNPVPPAVVQAIAAYESAKAPGKSVAAAPSIGLPSRGDPLGQQSGRADDDDKQQRDERRGQVGQLSHDDRDGPNAPRDPARLDGLDVV
jgi:hypothetical protein